MVFQDIPVSFAHNPPPPPPQKKKTKKKKKKKNNQKHEKTPKTLFKKVHRIFLLLYN